LRSPGHKGLWLAGLIVLGWLVSLAAVLLLAPQERAWPVLLAVVLLRTMVHTGLFIVAHDAMHGLLLPNQPRWNHRLGALALALYGALGYGRCLRNHQLHHRQQATSVDPDFPGEPGSGAFGWYVHFMGGYLRPQQMGLLLSGWGLLVAALSLLLQVGWRTALVRVLLGCTLPLLLSSVQLFVVGTYLPHRVQRLQPQQAAAAGPISLDWPQWLSLLACYHFGYHREHHEQPGLAWFQLPGAYRRNKTLALPDRDG
jgi:beta-carotene/zeaxanthin 4-ketolase